MRSGTHPIGGQEIGWLVSEGNVALWLPNDILFFSSGQALAGALTKGTGAIGTVLLLPEQGKPAGILAKLPDSLRASNPDEQLIGLLQQEDTYRGITKEDWDEIRASSNAPQLMRDAGNAETFACLLPAIKHQPLHGEQPSDIALLTIGDAGAHPMIVRADSQAGDETLMRGRRRELVAALEEIAPERFAGITQAHQALLPEDQLALTSYWADDIHWLSFEPIRQFTLQHPVLGSHAFGAWLIGDSRARSLAQALLRNFSTKKAAGAWLRCSQSICDPPDWINGGAPLPQAVAGGSRKRLLPMTHRIASLMEKDPQQIGQTLAVLKACDSLETRANPHLALVGKTVEGVHAAQNLLLADLVNAKKTDPAQFRRIVESMNEEQRQWLNTAEFTTHWREMRSQLAARLGELIYYRLLFGGVDERPRGFLPKRLPRKAPALRGLIARVGKRIGYAIERQIRSVPVIQGLNMAINERKFEGNQAANGATAGRGQLYNFILTVSRAEANFFNQEFDETYMPDRFHPLLMRPGRERIAAEVKAFGTAKELLSSEDLSVEGKQMHHCVGGYSTTCRTAKSSIWHLHAPDSKAGSTLQFSVNGTQIQIHTHLGYGDCNPTAGEKRLAAALSGAVQRIIRSETLLRERISLARASVRATLKKELPPGMGARLVAMQKTQWVVDDSKGAGLMCNEIGIRRGIPLPEKSLVCDLQRRKAYGSYAQQRIERSHTAQAMQTAVEGWDLNLLFKEFVHDQDDRLLTLDMFYEQIRPWLSKNIGAPDLLGLAWKYLGAPPAAKDLTMEEFNSVSVERGRAWRTARQERLAELEQLTALGHPQADEDAAPADNAADGPNAPAGPNVPNEIGMGVAA